MSAKTASQIVGTELLAEKSSEKATIKKDSPESLPKTISSKTVVQNVRTEMLAWKPFEKPTIRKWPYWNAAQQFILKKQSIK